jgi:glycerol-3-phosphate dehydrogenase (NAD(P)+)
MTTIAIVGAGYMGTATAWPLADNGHTVRLVGTHLDRDIIESCIERRYHPKLKRQLPDGVQPYYVEDVAQALDGADVIVSGVNSLGVHWIGRTIGPYLRAGQLIIAVTKGLEAEEDGNLRILPDVLYGELPEGVRDEVSLTAIGGPCIAGELAGRRQSCVVFGSRDGGAVERLATIFRTPYYHVWTTTDLVGLEMCAALKNGYTLGVGLAAGLLEREGGIDAAGAHMHNLAAGIFAQACTEIERMLQLMGSTRPFAYWLPGAGDLFVTVQGGRSMRLGKLMGQGHTYDEARELMGEETLEAAFIVQQMGVALPKLTAQGLIAPDDFPLMRALVDIVVHERAVDLPLDAFLYNSA